MEVEMYSCDEEYFLQRPLKRTVHAFWKVSGRSNVKRITREVYFRNDIGCGIDSCEKCHRPLSQGTLNGSKTILVLSTNVLVNQIIACEKWLSNCVVPATAAQEVKRRSSHIYGRLKNLLQTQKDSNDQFTGYYLFSNENFEETYVQEYPDESVLDRDNRAVRQCAMWYKNHAPKDTKVILLNDENHSDSVDTRSLDIAMDNFSGLTEMTIQEYAESMRHESEELFGYLIGERISDASSKSHFISEEHGGSRKAYYPPHLSESKIIQGVKDGSYYQGILHMYPGSYQHGFVACGREEFKIDGLENLNRAINGDCVCVELIDSNSKSVDCLDDKELDDDLLDIEKRVGDDLIDSMLLDSHTGDQPSEVITRECRVVGIIVRTRREYCGSLLPLDNSTNVQESYTSADRVFVPTDPRIPFIIIETRVSKELENKRIVVAIDSWDRFSRRPHGHWVSILGDIDDVDTECSVIFKENDVITRDFSIEAYKELPPENWEIPKEELERRTDFRDRLVFSVDPPGCKDIDDALGYRELPNGCLELSVHIADVTYFVKPDSVLDKEASERCTSVYLVDRKTDMLPSLLTTNLCSLVENKDRLCFSVIWEIKPDGSICNTRFGKGIIRSKKAFTYEEAQEAIDNNGSDEITVALKTMNFIAKCLREKRFKRGAVELESSDVNFEFDLAGVTSLKPYALYDTNRMVEEFMLLANTSVASKIYEIFPNGSLLRHHPPPVIERLNSLKRALFAQKICDFSFGTSKELNDSLKLIRGGADEHFASAVRILATRCMSQAIYSYSWDLKRDEFKHYGLCTDLYTHFTSPIRRYADVLVHRLLSAALQIEPLDRRTQSNLSAQCEMLNRRHRNAKWCSRESARLFSYLYFKHKGAQEANATVIGISNGRVALLSHQFGIDAIAKVDSVEHCQKTQTIKLRSGDSIKVLDTLRIKLDTSNKHLRNTVIAEILM